MQQALEAHPSWMTAVGSWSTGRAAAPVVAACPADMVPVVAACQVLFS